MLVWFEPLLCIHCTIYVPSVVLSTSQVQQDAYMCIEERQSSSEVVHCLCGATSDVGDEGEFVQCEVCLVWFHSACVKYSSQTHGKNFYCVRCLLKDVS